MYLYEAPCDAIDLGPVVLEREVVGRLAEGVLGVQESVPQVVVPPTLAEVEEAGDQICNGHNAMWVTIFIT